MDRDTKQTLWRIALTGLIFIISLIGILIDDNPYFELSCIMAIISLSILIRIAWKNNSSHNRGEQ